MDRIRSWWEKNNKKTIAVIITEIFTGFFLSFLVNANFGTDPASFLSLSVNARTGIPFGTLQLSLNAVLFAPMLIFSRTRYLGVGTIANMTLIGYSSDLNRFIMANVFPDGFFTLLPVRIVFLITGLIGFIICCAIYMNLSAGLSPYDSIPNIVRDHTGLPFTPVRMCWDFLFIVLGMIVGGRLPHIGNVLMAIFLGPTVSFVGSHFFNRNK
ncbi:MAG: YitT family protein [Candidatus Weimeria sp.]